MISSTAARRSIPAGSWIASSCRASSRSRQPWRSSWRRTTPLRRSRRCWRARLPASASRGTRSRMRAWVRSSPRGRAPGSQVEILLEGSPPGGVSDQQLWVVQQIAQAGGRIYYFRSNSAADIHDRYTYQHGKFWVLDGGTALIGSENLNPEAFPDDRQSRRHLRPPRRLPGDRCAVGGGGAAPRSWTPTSRRACTGMSGRGTRPTRPWARRRPASCPPTIRAAAPIRCRSRQPLVTQGVFTFQLIHSPEQALRDQDSLLGLVNRAGAGRHGPGRAALRESVLGRREQQHHGRSQPAPAGLHRRGAPRGQGARAARRLSSTTRI